MIRHVAACLTLTLGLLGPVAVAQAKDNPVVRIETSAGLIRAELYPDKAPETVRNFLQYAKDGFFEGTIFHRVIRNFMVQGGGYTATFEKKTTRAPIPNEADNGLLNVTGTLAMARTPDPNSATAQFFINVRDNAFLDHKDKTPSGWGYCVFGKVIEGMEIVRKIETVATGEGGPFPKDVPQTPMVIKSVKLEEGKAGEKGKAK
ncbi:MAG: peptidylprolyl isomerase [Myxococcota bacterium]|jgi:cyclophilin family peptidyl-prolyl cis-trans isomerase|nr:peptidylprolyl isomerase [Myxococcota bacterium]